MTWVKEKEKKQTPTQTNFVFLPFLATHISQGALLNFHFSSLFN